jgi:LPS sulfotransferase NodH
MARQPRSYLVCATQRSGSTLFCQLLGDTGVAGRPEEFFEAMRGSGQPPHPSHFLQGLPSTGLGIRDDPRSPDAPDYSSLEGIQDYREHLRRTFDWGTTDNGVFGAKLMFNQLPELHALAGDLPEFAGLSRIELLEQLFDRPRYIWVSRGDKVRQAVSLWKALQTRSWRHDAPTDDVSEPEYHFAGIDHLVARFEAEDRGWGEFFSAHGIVPLSVSYEDDLERDPDGTVRKALAWIEVTAPADWRAGQPTERQADRISEEWVAAYHRDCAARLSAKRVSTEAR